MKSLIEKMILEIIDQAQYDFYGFIKIKADHVSIELLQTFEQRIKTLKAMYLFEKRL